LSENIKLRFDPSSGRVGMAAQESSSTDQPQIDDAEAQMRRALGLDGEQPRPRHEPDRQDMTPRPTERFGGNPFNASTHRRRFAQDGDVQFSVVRRDQDPNANRNGAAAPTSSRLQRTEAALAAETAARDKAERALSDLQATLRDLQTKIGHAELTKHEAQETLRKEREATAELRQAARDHAEAIEEANARAEAAEQAAETARAALAQERSARSAAERALREAVAAREEAERLLEIASADTQPSAPVRAEPRPSARPTVARAQPVTRASTAAEPEPVKWWLMKPTAKKR
jgi:hypothetical protein